MRAYAPDYANDKYYCTTDGVDEEISEDDFWAAFDDAYSAATVANFELNVDD